jgi:poly-gamma-glutamate synthesis protein (capsule biosynthesis protein)
MITISFTGDIAFSKYFKDHWNRDFLDAEIISFLKESDHVVANVECPMTASAVTSKMEIVHFSDPAAGSWFKSIGADIWSLSNNHAMDCGEAGLLDTKAAAEANGAVTVGAGLNIDEAAKPLLLPEAGGIGILAVTYRRGEFIRATSENAGCLLFDEP